jgi:hypothetical protein
MPSVNFLAFKNYTAELGFPDWKLGEGQFGSFTESSEAGNELFYTEKPVNPDVSCLLFYRPRTETLNVIVFDVN